MRTGAKATPEKISPPAVKAAGQSNDSVGSRRSLLFWLTRWLTEASHVASMQGVAAPLGDSVVRGCGIKLRDLGLQVLVDQQKRLHGATEIAVAIRHDFVDRGLTRS